MEWPESYDYIPPGFLPLSLFELGNGDTHGFYWPIGKEGEEPLLCETYHDYGYLEPHAASLEGLVKLKVLHGYKDPDAVPEIPRKLGFTLPPPHPDRKPSISERLAADSRSPNTLLAAGIEALEAGQVNDAETYLQQAIAVLPEYTKALFYLAKVYHRLKRDLDAARGMVEVLSSPICFGLGYGKECLHWLQRLSDADFPELTHDPMWIQRHQITLESGVKYNNDFHLYEEAISEYLRQGDGIRAVRLRVLVGELMWRETLAFQDRYKYSGKRHAELLRENLKQAGLSKRLPAVQD
jgi:tetratricopeptide (TPR) repeat protein